MNKQRGWICINMVGVYKAHRFGDRYTKRATTNSRHARPGCVRSYSYQIETEVTSRPTQSQCGIASFPVQLLQPLIILLIISAVFCTMVTVQTICWSLKNETSGGCFSLSNAALSEITSNALISRWPQSIRGDYGRWLRPFHMANYRPRWLMPRIVAHYIVDAELYKCVIKKITRRSHTAPVTE